MNFQVNPRWAGVQMGYANPQAPNADRALSGGDPASMLTETYAGWNHGLTDGLANSTLRAISITGFLCPSDINPGNREYASNINYPINNGLPRIWSKWRLNGMVYTPSPWDPEFSPGAIGFGDVSDGASKTVIFSEWIKGVATPGDFRGAISSVYVGGYFQNADPMGNYYRDDTLRTIISNCELLTTAEPSWNWKGEYWQVSDSGRTCYSHLLTPNRMSCGLTQRTDGLWRPAASMAWGSTCAWWMAVCNSSQKALIKKSGGPWARAIVTIDTISPSSRVPSYFS